jgi:hypothetical protein
MAADDNEVRITIKALTSGFDKLPADLEVIDRWRNTMLSQASLLKQQYMEAAAAARDAASAQEALNAATLGKQQATMQTVGDLGAQQLKEFTAAQAEATAGNDAYNQALSMMTEGQVEAGSSMLTFAGNAGKGTQATTAATISTVDLAATYYLLKQALDVVIGAFQDLYQAANAGAQFERLQASGKALAATFGVDLPQAVAKLQAASLDTISAQSAMIDTNKALLTGAVTNVDTLANLMLVAAVNGRALGRSATDNFAQVIQGVDALSTRLLAFSGIVVNDQVAYEKFAASIGTTAAQLDGQQKRQALVNAILDEYLPRAKAAGGLTDDNATAYDRLAAHVQDATKAFQAQVADGLTPLIAAIDKVLFLTKDQATLVQAQAPDILKVSTNYTTYARTLGAAANAAGFFFNATGDLMKLIEFEGTMLPELVAKNVELTAAQWDQVKGVGAVTDAFDRQAAAAAALEAHNTALQTALDTFTVSLDKMQQLSDKFSMVDAGKLVIQYMESLTGALKPTQAQIDQLSVSLGVADQGFIDFRNAMIAAAAQGQLTGEAVSKLWQKFIEPTQLAALGDKLTAALAKVQDTFNTAMEKLGSDTARQRLAADTAYGRKKQDIATQDARKLQDLQTEISTKTEALADTHNKNLQNIEIQHQQQIAAINQRYDLSRLKALIDGDGRALFEANAQRAADLATANKDAGTKATAENANYAQSLKDLADYQQQKKDQIALDDQRAKDDAQKAFQQQNQDIATQNAQKLSDIVKAYNDQSGQVNAQYVLDAAALDAQNTKIEKAYQDSYNTRVGDMLDFFKTNQNILKQLQSGTVSIDTVLQEWNQAQGIPFGGIPWSPQSLPHNCPSGCHWSDTEQMCLKNGAGLTPCSTTSGPSGSSDSGITQTTGSGTTGPQTLKVTLNVTGDGVLAAAVRQSALNAVWDVIN